MKNLNVFILIFGLTLFSNSFARGSLPRLFINEFMASNSNTILTPDYGESADWLEIYNAEDSTVDIGGFYLTDDLSEPQKWQVPANSRISASGFIDLFSV